MGLLTGLPKRWAYNRTVISDSQNVGRIYRTVISDSQNVGRIIELL
jgi:hypothetical protein